MAPPATDSKDQQGPKEGLRKFIFPSHQSHMLTLAKMCQENSEYTDCVIQCGDFTCSDSEEQHKKNRLNAHRLVLGCASPFLKNVFSDIPQSLPEATILVPGVKRNVCQALLDFLYTGEMKVNREDTSDLQLLIETLQIDPELISVDVIKANKEAEHPKDQRQFHVEESNETTSSIQGTEQEAENPQVDSSKIHGSKTSLCIANKSLAASMENSPGCSNLSTKESSEIEKKTEADETVNTMVNPRKRKASEETSSTDSLNGKECNEIKITKVSDCEGHNQ